MPGLLPDEAADAPGSGGGRAQRIRGGAVVTRCTSTKATATMQKGEVSPARRTTPRHQPVRPLELAVGAGDAAVREIRRAPPRDRMRRHPIPGPIRQRRNHRHLTRASSCCAPEVPHPEVGSPSVRYRASRAAVVGRFWRLPQACTHRWRATRCSPGARSVGDHRSAPEYHAYSSHHLRSPRPLRAPGPIISAPRPRRESHDTVADHSCIRPDDWAFPHRGSHSRR